MAAYFNGHDHNLQHIVHQSGGAATSATSATSASGVDCPAQPHQPYHHPGQVGQQKAMHFFVSGSGGGAYIQKLKGKQVSEASGVSEIGEGGGMIGGNKAVIISCAPWFPAYTTHYITRYHSH